MIFLPVLDDLLTKIVNMFYIQINDVDNQLGISGLIFSEKQNEKKKKKLNK